MSVPCFLACFRSETAGPGGEEKEERKGEKKELSRFKKLS